MSAPPCQWSVFLVNLDPAVGSKQAGRRPVLVVSREVANVALPVVTALPLTSLRKGRRIYPNEVLLPAGTAGLDRESVVMAHQIRTLSKRRLGALLGRIDDQELRAAVRAAVRVQLDLES